MTAPRVLFLIDEVEGFAAGGTERQVFETIAALTSGGFHVELAILRQAVTLDPAIAGCPVHDLRFPKRLSTIEGVRAIAGLRSWIRKRRFHIVQTFFSDANLIGPVAAKFAGVPVVIGGRRNLNHWMTSKFAHFQYVSNLFADRLLANSEMVRNAVCRTEKAPVSKVDVIYNAIYLQRFQRSQDARNRARSELGISADQIVIGNVANLRPVKGVLDFVESASLAARANPKCLFIQVGEGELRPQIESRLHELGLRERFILLGRRSDVPELLSAFDIGALTSHAEGFSNSILEYMAAELPVVATDVGGNREALGTGAGMIVNSGDRPAIADALLRLAGDPELRHTLGRTGLNRARELFSSERIRQLWLSYYGGLLQAKRVNS